MTYRLKRSPLPRDILMMLEEAGAETVGTVIATAKPSDLDAFAADVDGLVKLALVRKEANEIILTEQGRASLRK